MSAARERITAELAGLVPCDRKHARALRLASFEPDWIGLHAAARILNTSRHLLSAVCRDYLDSAIESKPASLNGSTSARGCGKIFRRNDVERVASIRRRCHVSLAVACRIYAAIKQGGPL